MSPGSKLVWIKILHSLVWAVFASAVLAIPVLAHAGALEPALWLIGLVMLEVLVLLCNRLRCPLTDMAARYTADRRDNFDIYLPCWLARYNKPIFGSLFLAGVVYTAAMWLISGGGG